MRYILLIAFFCLGCHYSDAQVEVNSTKTQAVVKASYIYNFAKYCKWDESFYASDKFKIAVYGDRDLYEELLDKYGTRPINNQSIEVVWVQNPDELFDEQIVFIGRSKKSEIEDLSYTAMENSSLLITDADGVEEKGAVINFIVVENALGFNVNKKQAELNLVQLGTRVVNWANKIIE